ncbi:hypothetical protein ElyMa_001334800 [Elysia marginata]|uniref:CTNNB1 binding N-teminal domain-containing protein n=1 Tax=Elysia marginata TaxID=1093978 RepID=A0AAV4IQC4_9GAST|nr:hypothetical protein ElyMa_001334800 [Elysia marginata]
MTKHSGPVRPSRGSSEHNMTKHSGPVRPSRGSLGYSMTKNRDSPINHLYALFNSFPTPNPVPYLPFFTHSSGAHLYPFPYHPSLILEAATVTVVI